MPIWRAILLLLSLGILPAAAVDKPQCAPEVAKKAKCTTGDLDQERNGAKGYTSMLTSNGPFFMIGDAQLDKPLDTTAFEHYQCAIDLLLERANFPSVPGDVGWRRMILPREKPLLHVHIHNDAGTTACLAAYMNGEHVVMPNENCNWAEFDHIWRRRQHNASYVTGIGSTLFHPPSCAQRAAHFEKGGFTFGAIEREFHVGDFCPDQFRYSIVIRDPILSLRSYTERQSTELRFVENSAVAYGFHKYPRCGKVSSYSDCHMSEWLFELIQAIQEKKASPGREGGDETPGDGPGFFGWKLLDNYKIRSIVGALYNSEPGTIGPDHLQQAIDVLSKFDYVKTISHHEHWNASAPELCWSRATQKRAHPSDSSNHKYFYNETVVKVLTELNKYDIQLYEHFAKLKK